MHWFGGLHFMSDNTGWCHAGDSRHMWRKLCETELCKVISAILGKTSLTCGSTVNVCTCYLHGSSLRKQTASLCLTHDKSVLVLFRLVKTSKYRHFTRWCISWNRQVSGFWDLVKLFEVWSTVVAWKQGSLTSIYKAIVHSTDWRRLNLYRSVPMFSTG